jgi:hypothetical protein
LEDEEASDAEFMGFGSVEKPMLARECWLKKNNKLLYLIFYHFLIK